MWWFAPGFGTPREPIQQSLEFSLPVLPLGARGGKGWGEGGTLLLWLPWPAPVDPPPPPPHIRKDFPPEKNEIHQKGRKLEADFRCTNFFLASDPPTPPKMMYQRRPVRLYRFSNRQSPASHPFSNLLTPPPAHPCTALAARTALARCTDVPPPCGRAPSVRSYGPPRAWPPRPSDKGHRGTHLRTHTRAAEDTTNPLGASGGQRHRGPLREAPALHPRGAAVGAPAQRGPATPSPLTGRIRRGLDASPGLVSRGQRW